MSKEDWLQLSDVQRRQLYAEYEEERGAACEFSNSLAPALCAELWPERRPQVQTRASDAIPLLRSFRTAVKALVNLHSFAYTPTFPMIDHWERTWRNIKLIYEGANDCHEEEAFQLFVALRITLLDSNRLQSVELFTLADAFWGPSHLRHLLGGFDQISDTSLSYTEELVEFNRGFSRVKQLNCRVDISLSDGNYLVFVAQAVSKCLKEAVQLERLDLAFRQDAVNDCGFFTLFTHNFHPNGSVHVLDESSIEEDPKIPEDDAETLEGDRQWMFVPNELIVASRYLLLNPIPAIANLQRLSLSLATIAGHLMPFLSRFKQLRHLRLYSIALLRDGDCWERVFQEIAYGMRLDSIELLALEDRFQKKARLILYPEASVWKVDGRNETLYKKYERAIIDFILRKSTHVPLLSPEDFLNEA